MYLNKDEEEILHGEYGETRQKMMEVLVALGRVFGADKLIPIVSAQVSGASYKTIGEWGLQWLEGLNAKVVAPTMLNPIGMPRNHWDELGITKKFAERQIAIIEVYRRLGVKIECTCTPYYSHIVRYGDHIAWAESSAVVYANSVIGARTNREGGPSALAAGIIGKTPNYGFHLINNRRPHLVIEFDGKKELIQQPEFFGALGYIAGKLIGNTIPIFLGIKPKRDQLKALGAAMAATGAISLFHIKNITPEAQIFKFDTTGLEQITIESKDITALFKEIEVDAVAIGCPHCSGDELKEIALLIAGKKVKKPLFIFSSHYVLTSNQKVVEQIQNSGAKVISDTCMVVSPFMDQFKSIMVDSGKAMAYVPNMCGAVTRIGTLEECIKVATT